MTASFPPPTSPAAHQPDRAPSTAGGSRLDRYAELIVPVGVNVGRVPASNPQMRRRTAVTLPRIVASSPSMGE